MNKYIVAVFIFVPYFNSEACSMNECQVGYFSDSLTEFNETLFERAHNWSNGFPFSNRWEEGAINFSDNGMKIELSDSEQSNEKYKYRSGELRSRHFYGHGCFSIEMKPIASPGVITSFFLFAGKHDKYEGSNAQHNEIDIEFLGKHTKAVQFNFWTNDDDYSSNNAVLIPLDFDASQDFHRYAISWSKDKIQWFVDGEMRHEVKQTTENPIPNMDDTRLKIMANVWPVDEKLSSWAGKMNALNQPLNGTYRNLSYQPESSCGTKK
ncbi:family 16 glycosylhydrolase [Aliivibrio fischeri]|uniref:family 16 glycosylhydrolase n=1 Tax=Aliivibrio fischeri TaxID=668 RepID=UPI0007C43B0E|nr:family 16 glycosylhydrolase [Aliivibrio fischeri]MUL01705.1 family 16 glycosylhydrolase [Aliivibrio fischeri]